NYAVLQVLIEELTDRPLIALYEERFFRPHELDAMRVCPFLLDDTRGHAVGYATREDRLVRAEGVNNVASLAQGGLCGSALDLARWLRLLATGRIIDATSFARMTTPTRLDDGSETGYGFGVGLVPQDGVRRVGHSGIGFGYSSSAAYYPDAELTIVVLANRFGYPDALERQIARRLLALPEPDYGDVGITPAQRRAWTGRYDVGMFGWTPTFFERDGRLWFELFGPDTRYALIRTRDGWLVPETVPDAMRFRFEETPSGLRLRMQTMGTQDWSGFASAAPATKPPK
ncbi:MAG TPA: serine hydrolase domain-containing protein, partial [Candidatus Saccharimonadia bacterium]|nr:serine hydrolase domain-containing protein [Candidatus Saccharimonadia bacterium]